MTLRRSFVAGAVVALIVACAGEHRNYDMIGGQSVTMPKGTLTGGASVGEANALE